MTRLHQWLYERFNVAPWQVAAAVFGFCKTVLQGVALGIGVAVTFSSGSVLSSVMEYGQFRNIEAGIESMRSDLHRNPCNEFLIAAVAEINKRIAYEQKSNERWLTGWASPNGWNRISRIEEQCRLTRC